MFGVPTRQVRIIVQGLVFALWVALILATRHPLDSWIAKVIPVSLFLRMDPLVTVVVCGGMRMMVKHLDEFQTLRSGPAAAGVTWMGIAGNDLGAHIVKALQIGDDLFEHLQAARAVQVADVGRDDGTRAPSQRDGILHVTTNGK